MKKLLLLLAVAFSASLFACGGDKNAENNDSTACCDTNKECCEAAPDTCVADTVVADTVVADTVVAE